MMDPFLSACLKHINLISSILSGPAEDSQSSGSSRFVMHSVIIACAVLVMNTCEGT